MKKTLIAQAIALIGCAGYASFAFAQAEPVAKVVITGSNIKRTATEGSNSVQTLTRKDIAQTGATTVADLLTRIPALSSGGQVDSRDGGFSKGLATASMRGLGSASTLVLLNGRRIAPGAYADPNSGQSTQYDLNSLPLSAIERVEILKDGASAIYGSDAIAGVINFITKTNYRGGDVAANISSDIHGNFGRQNLNGAFGFGDLESDGYNAFVAVDLSQRQRASIADAVRVETDAYRTITGRLSNFYSGISKHPVYYREARTGSGSYNRYAGADLSCDPSQILTGSTDLVPMLASDPLIGNRFCNYPGWEKEDAQGESENQNVLGRVEFKVGAGMNAFVEASYNRSFIDYVGPSRTISGRSVSTVFPKFGAGTSFRPVLGVNHPDNPTRGTATPVPVAVAYRFENVRGGSSNENEAARIVAGLRGTNFGWDWDTALLHNESKRHQVSYNFVHLPTAQRLYTENIPLATIVATPGVTRDVTLDGTSKISQFDFKGSREIGSLPGGAIGMAAGVEFKRESMNIVPDPLSVNGEMVGIANQYSEASRRVGSAFVEFRTPFTQALEMDWAARFDKYEGFRRSITPKVGAKYTFSPTAALRATYSRGFRAPSLTQMVNGGTQYFLNNFEDKLRCNKPGSESLDCARSLSGVAASNPDLEPEKARSFTVGLVFAPATNLDVLVDYYNIEKKKEVDLLDPISVIENPRYADRVYRDPNQGTWLRDANGNLIPNSGPLISIATPYVNAGGTSTSGIDVEATLRNNLGQYGRLSTRLNTSYLINFKKAQNQGDPAFDLVGYNGGVAYDLTSAGELPRWKSSLASTWSYGKHTTTLTANFVSGVSLMALYSVQEDGSIGPYEEPYCELGRPGRQPNYANLFPDCRVKSWTTLDLSYSFDFSKNLAFGLNIANLLDERAPYDSVATSYATGGYNSTLHNARGRYFTAKVNYRF